MFAHKAKPFPGIPAKSVLFPLSQTCLFILATNWVMQGMRGMDRGELLFRLTVTCTVCAALSAVNSPPSGAEFFGVLAIAHSFNFALNGHPWVCVRYCRFYRRSQGAIDVWLDRWIQRLRQIQWVEECVVLGSLARGATNSRSDIDLRFIISNGAFSWARVNLLLLAIRADAALRAIPLDSYAYDTPRSLLRFDQSEPLLIISDQRGRLREMFADRKLENA